MALRILLRWQRAISARQLVEQPALPKECDARDFHRQSGAGRKERVRHFYSPHHPAQSLIISRAHFSSSHLFSKKLLRSNARAVEGDQQWTDTVELARRPQDLAKKYECDWPVSKGRWEGEKGYRAQMETAQTVVARIADAG
jgi:hypothetical protein